jgi:putative transferase (TIGR04331 family)
LIIKSPFKKTVFKWGYQLISKLAKCLVRDSDAFVVNSYMPKKQEVKLQLALGQCPQLWDSSISEISEKPDQMLRVKLANRFSSKSDNNLEDILSVMLFELLPVCYLEGFASLNKHVERQPWPKSPKFIFTSNNFDADEVFKLWAATRVELGSKYFTGQHGNNYGAHRYMFPAVEEIISDKFLTWGWTDGLPQHTPAFLFKTSGCKVEQYDCQGGLLLIELHLSIRLNTWDSYATFGYYFREQQNFVKNLNDVIKKELTIRLHSAHKYYQWSEYERWMSFDPLLKINRGDGAISNLISKSRLVVHSYDSTGILETLSQNIPTLAFWQNGLDHLRESAKPYYQLLVDVGIVHFTAESVAEMVNEVWDDVDGWWNQVKLQDARKEFCDRYAKVSQTPIADLKKILY